MIAKRCLFCAKKLKDGYCVNKNCPESLRAEIEKRYQDEVAKKDTISKK